MSDARRTRFDAYAAGLADGEADRAAGLKEPRDGFATDWPFRMAAYASGYNRAFPREGFESGLPPTPLPLDLAGALAEAIVGSWAEGRPKRSPWTWLVVGGWAFAAQWLTIAARRRRAQALGDAEVPPALVAPGRIARAQGLALGWKLMRRRGVVGDGVSSRLGRNLAMVFVARLDRRADVRAWATRPERSIVDRCVGR